jgi:broad specificity phosphatase PhoE
LSDADLDVDAPSKILLMRHAEKPDDPKNPYLTEEGRARAAKLAQFIPATFGKPDFVFAAAVNKNSMRAYLTMQPLCEAIGVRPDTSFAAKEYEALAAKLLSDDVFAQKLVVACWTHGELPALANALNAHQGDYPNPWDASVFNLILQLDYSGAAAPTVTRVTQPF